MRCCSFSTSATPTPPRPGQPPPHRQASQHPYRRLVCGGVLASATRSRSADFQSAVSPISIGRAPRLSVRRAGGGEASRLETCEQQIGNLALHSGLRGKGTARNCLPDSSACAPGGAAYAAWSLAHAAVRRGRRARWRLPCSSWAKNSARRGIDYPKPATIGPDRSPTPWLPATTLARRSWLWILARGHLRRGGPRGNYVGGIIAPGLAAMTDYLHEKTACCPHPIREIQGAIGSPPSTPCSSAVHGYRVGTGVDRAIETRTEGASPAG